jgi:hypothetical protein
MTPQGALMPIKEATFWVGLTVFGTGLFFWVEGGDRLLYAIALTLIGIAAAAYSVVAHHYPQMPKIRVSIVLLLLTWVAVGYDVYDRHHPRFGYDANRAWDDAQPLVRVYNAHFANETVYVDGKNFIDPVFDGVTLIFNGTGPFSMENARWVLHDNKVNSRVGTRNKIVAAAFLLHCALVQANGYQMGCVNEGPNAPQTMDMPPLPK